MITLNYDAIMEDISPTNEMTEQEWLQTADTEQLAEWIGDVVDEVCDTSNYNCKNCFKWCNRNKVIEWLKQPHTNE